MPSRRRFWTRALIVILAISLSIVLMAGQTARADQAPVRNETIQLNVGDSLIIQSNGLTIQQIFLQGNLSSITFQKPAQYPAATFELNASEPGTYDLQVMFSRTSDYTVNLYVKQFGTDVIGNSTSYYISGGSFELDVTAYFNPNQTEPAASMASMSSWDEFSNWMGNFGEAFPLWVKALYFILGVQFLIVGGLWIRRESGRKEAATQPMDAGDKAYLWLDVGYKFLLTSFVAIVAVMGGELILLFVLRFMFLVSISLLSLWDLFVVGFAAGVVIIVYLIRFALEKAFDLKPFEDA